MRILFVLEHYYPYLGGAEKLFKQLAEGLAARGGEVRVLTTRFRKELPAREVIGGVHVERVQCFNRFLFTLFSLPRLAVLARQVDFIHTTTYNAALPAWLIGRLYRKPTILTFHEVWGKLWFELPFLTKAQRWLYYSFEQLVTRLPFDHYVAVSDATKQALVASGIQEDKIRLIYNGIDYTAFAGYQWEAPEKFTVLYFGRLGVSKGLDLLIPAWGAFVKKHPESKLQLVIPKYPERLYQTIQQLIEQWCPTGSVELRHELTADELYELVRKVSAVAIPSYSEGFCFVAVEAMAMGVPIISSGRGALAEVVHGTYSQLTEQSVVGMEISLEHAFRQAWLHRPPRSFPLQRAMEAYLAFYDQIA